MPKANETQVMDNGQASTKGHYQGQMQHWDFAAANGLGYFEGQITKYVTRWRKKNGRADLLKAQHFLQKLLELVDAGVIIPEQLELPLQTDGRSPGQRVYEAWIADNPLMFGPWDTLHSYEKTRWEQVAEAAQ